MTKNIMVVDDEPDILTSLRVIFEYYGYDVITVNNGEKCIDELKKGFKGIILMDIMMPKMDGYEVLRQLRESVAAKQIPVIFLTAKGQKKDVLKGMELGANDYLVKPYIFADLHGKIKKLIGEKKD